MRLTKTDKEAFVARVMQDVPKVAYYDLFRAAVQKAIIAAAPAAVQRCFQANREYLESRTLNVFDNLYSEEFYGLTERIYAAETLIALIGQPAYDALDATDRAWTAQNNRLSELQNKLEGTVAAYTTRKALAAALPEFEKYLPSESEKGTNLPALANVVTDFMQAGWPKDRAAPDVVT